MTEKYILYIYFILEQTCGNQYSFCIFKDKKKVDAARFLDARGDEKQVIYLERPNSHQLRSPYDIPKNYDICLTSYDLEFIFV